MPTLIAINGAAGRMGQRIVQLASEDRDLTIVAALESPKHPESVRMPAKSQGSARSASRWAAIYP